MPDSHEELKAASLFSVAGKVAVVTGGGTGIGKMIAAALVRNGAKVYIASRKLQVVEDTAKELNSIGASGTCIALQADLTTREQAEALAAQIKARESKLHILVNNAGMAWGDKLTDFNEKNGWDRLMALNVKSVFYLTVALLPLLSSDATNIDPGRVINISSIMGSSPIPDMHLSAPGTASYSYNTSKAAVDHLTRVLAATLAEHKVTVNAIAPGVFPSLMTKLNNEKVSCVTPSVDPFDMAANGPSLAVNDLFSVTGKVAVVTGGGTGIGKMIATALVKNGAKVYIASRKFKVVEETAKELNAIGAPGSCIPLTADLTSREQAEALAAQIKVKESKIHILVNK
ncbi:hypothetical protein HK405_003516 [Cladochytrium tenue]|nr:hypothetical protein HK405_003516 [Cladochytrium tenue]